MKAVEQRHYDYGGYDDSCVTVRSKVPEKYAGIFAPFDTFNPMQTILADQLLNSNENVVVAAPTGSGKTVCHELAIIRVLQQKSYPQHDFKCVFVAPNKALCQQRVAMWEKSFSNLGIRIIEVTGDTEIHQSLALIAKANIVITTPEKWDALTRSWRKHIFLLGSIDLLLIDEVHHLHEGDRGAVLEAICVRMRTLSNVYRSRAPSKASCELRIVALSATLPNVSDIGEWLKCRAQSVHFFDETYRPVPLTLHVIGYNNVHGNKTFLFDRSLDEKVVEVIRKYSPTKQILIFCCSKKGTETLSALLASILPRFVETSSLHRFNDENLDNLVSKGFAYHHAGIPPDDRSVIEDLYLKGKIWILACTSTLAHGVNLPAHLVIIRGTSVYRGSHGYERLPRSMVTQMIGRAGRPGLDDHGIAVIMTSKEDKSYYEAVESNTEVVESNLMSMFVEVICAEMTSGVIEDIADAINWLRNTFFYIRVRKNPQHYGYESITSTEELEEKLKETCLKAVKDLTTAGIVEFDEMGYGITPLVEAFIMTRHLIRFQTMLIVMHIPSNSDIEKLLIDLSTTEETKTILRRNEKTLLLTISKHCRYPVKTKTIVETFQKTFVMIQAAVERAYIGDFAARVEQSELVEKVLRILRAVQDYCVERLKGKLLESCIILQRSLIQRLWETNPEKMLSQIPMLSDIVRKSLVDNNFKSLDDLNGINNLRLQQTIRCSAQDAIRILNFYHVCKLNRMVMSTNFGDDCLLEISIKTATSLTDEDKKLLSSKPITFQLVCYHVLSGKLICYRKLWGESSTRLSLPDDVSQDDLQISLIANIVGLDIVVESYQSIKLDEKKNTTRQKFQKIDKQKMKSRETVNSAFGAFEYNESLSAQNVPSEDAGSNRPESSRSVKLTKQKENYNTSQVPLKIHVEPLTRTSERDLFSKHAQFDYDKVSSDKALHCDENFPKIIESSQSKISSGQLSEINTLRRKAHELGFETEVRKFHNKISDSHPVEQGNDIDLLEKSFKMQSETMNPLISLKRKQDRELALLISRHNQETKNVRYANEKNAHMASNYAGSANCGHIVASTLISSDIPSLKQAAVPLKFFRGKSMSNSSDTEVCCKSTLAHSKEPIELSFAKPKSVFPTKATIALAAAQAQSTLALPERHATTGRNLSKEIDYTEIQSAKSDTVEDAFEMAFF